MKYGDVRKHAERVVDAYLAAGMPFDWVSDDERLEGLSLEDHESIHIEANEILSYLDVRTAP